MAATRLRRVGGRDDDLLHHVPLQQLRVSYAWGISYEFIKWAGKYRTNPVLKFISWPGLLVQNLTTREPDDDQLEVALISLKRALEHEGALEAPNYESGVRFLSAEAS